MAAPVKISLNPPDTLQSVLSRSEPKAHGPFTVGTNLYLVLTDDDPGGTQDFRLQIWKSTDNGATWTEQSSGSGPIILGNYFATLNGTTIELVYISLPPAPLRRITYQEFNCALDTYGVPDSSGSDLSGSGQLQVTKLVSGDYLCFYISTFDYLSIRRISGVWQAPVTEFAKPGAFGSLTRDHGLTSDSLGTGYYVYSEVVSSVARLKMRSLTLGGVLSAESIIAVGSSGFSSFFRTGPLSVWQSGLVIPTFYDEVGFPQTVPGAAGFWFGTPLSSPLWTFFYPGASNRGQFMLFIPTSFTDGVLFWTTLSTNQVNQATLASAVWGSVTTFYDWGTNPPAGGGVVPPADQLLEQLTIAAISGGYGMALAMAYNFPAEDYSTFYFAGGAAPPPVNVQLNRFEMT